MTFSHALIAKVSIAQLSVMELWPLEREKVQVVSVTGPMLTYMIESHTGEAKLHNQTRISFCNIKWCYFEHTEKQNALMLKGSRVRLEEL